MYKNKIRRLCSYAILKSMFEHGYDDYLDCFVPIVIQVFTSNDFSDVDFVQSELDSFFPLPRLMMLQILDRAQRKRYLHKEKKQERYRLSQKAVRAFIDERKKVAKRIEELTSDIEHYFKENFFRPDKPIQNLIESFIDNTGFLLNIQSLSNQENIKDIVETKEQKLLFKYLQNISLEKPQHIDAFREIVMGSIVAEALEWTDIHSVKVESFKKCEVFLDTNFIFSILGFHGQQIGQPAFELYRNLRFFDFKIGVFDFTLEQIRQVLQRYSPDDVVVIQNPQRPSVHNTLKSWGWDEKKVADYIEDLESTLQQKEIKIVFSGMNLFDGQSPDDERLIQFFDIYGGLFERRKAKYGYESNRFGKQHDLAAIIKIQELRQNTAVTINDPKAIFLTSDRKLAEFNQIDMSRPVQGAMSEVNLDTGFTSLLWFLSKGRADINFSLPTIIAAYSRNLFINEKIWDRFQAVFKQVIEEEEIDAQNIPNIFYSTIQNTLNEFSDDNINLITRTFVEDKMREAKEEFNRQKRDEEHTKRILRQKEDTIHSLQVKNEELKEEKRSIQEIIIKRNRIIYILLGGLILVFAIAIFGYIYFR